MFQRVLKIPPLFSRAVSNVETYSWPTSNQKKSTTLYCKTTLIPRGTLNGSTSGSKTLRRGRKSSSTCSTYWNLKACLTKAWKSWPIQKRSLNRNQSAGIVQEKTSHISRTTIGGSRWPTIRDAIILSLSPITSSTIMTPYSSHIPNRIPIRIWWMISKR